VWANPPRGRSARSVGVSPTGLTPAPLSVGPGPAPRPGPAPVFRLTQGRNSPRRPAALTLTAPSHPFARPACEISDAADVLAGGPVTSRVVYQLAGLPRVDSPAASSASLPAQKRTTYYRMLYALSSARTAPPPAPLLFAASSSRPPRLLASAIVRTQHTSVARCCWLGADAAVEL